ncbi:MAG: hypothetical protein JSS66_13165 [Armatimonadetes bacterium]|nr:hypothetical protein [Armatimonadota bacterium]
MLATSVALSASAAGFAGQADVVWHNFLAGQDADLAQSVTMPNGDIVMVGSKQAINRDLWIVRMTQSGTTVWSRTYPKPGAPGDVFPVRAALATNGNVYVASEVSGNATISDFYFLAVDGAGNFVVDRTVDEYPNDQVSDMEIGSQGNVLFTGDGLSTDQPIVVKMDPNFGTLWTYYFGDPAATIGQGSTDLDVNAAGQVLVAGLIQNGTQGDVALDLLDSNGLPIFQKTIGSPNDNDGDPSVVLDPFGNAYLAYVRSVYTVNALGRVSKFDVAGAFQWNYDTPLADFVRIGQAPNGDILFAASQDDAPFNTTVSRLTTAGGLVWSNVVTTPNLDRNLLDNMAVSADGIITTLSHVSILGKVGADWLVCQLDPAGNELYQWRFDSGPGFYDIPGDIETLAGGGVIVCGRGDSAGGTVAHAYRLQAVYNLFPDTATVRLGRLNAGKLNSLTRDDNDYYQVCKFIVPNNTVPPINVEFEATVPANFPVGGINFGTLAKANTVGLTQDAELFNWTTSAWESSTQTALGLTEVVTTIVGTPASHVLAGTGRVKARARVRATGPTSVATWCVSYDQVGWRLTP